MFYFSKSNYVIDCHHFKNIVKFVLFMNFMNFMNFQLYKLFRLNP